MGTDKAQDIYEQYLGRQLTQEEQDHFAKNRSRLAKQLQKIVPHVVGPEGPLGERGPPGERGADGVPGERGTTGRDGLVGEAGPFGEIGPKGSPGAVGEIGPIGRDGADGLRGETGTTGTTGVTGDEGSLGERGSTGLSGPRGVRGSVGTKGERGVPGERGGSGSSGEHGSEGEHGEKGDRGERGEKGEPGTVGRTLNILGGGGFAFGGGRAVEGDVLRYLEGGWRRIPAADLPGGGGGGDDVTLGVGSDPALTLVGQELTLADVLTPAEHTTIGDAAPHHASFLQADADLLYEALGDIATHAALGSVHHDPVTVSGTPDYITLADQDIVLGQVDLAADVSGLLPAASVVLPFIGSPTYTHVEHLNTVFHSTGWYSGGAITDAGGATIDVATGTGALRATDSPVAQLLHFDWSSATGLAIVADSIRYIGVEYNAGSPQVVVRATYNWNFNTDFPLGTVVNEGGTLHIQFVPHKVGDHASNMIQRVYGVNHIARDTEVGGLVFSEAGTRRVVVSAGAFWVGLSSVIIAAIDTDPGVGDTFTTYSAGGQEATGVSQWPNEQYDNGGTLTTMTTNRWANLWWYLELDGDLVMVYGTAQYTSEALAGEEAAPTTLPNRLQVGGVLAARFIFQKSAGTAAQILSAFEKTFSVVGVTDHRDLGGLGDDDHLQYALLDGRVGGQILYGGTNPVNDLFLRSTTHASKGRVFVNQASQFNVNVDSSISFILASGATMFMDSTAPARALKLSGAASDAGLVIGVDVHLYRGGPDVLALAAGDAFRIIGLAGDFGAPLDGMVSYNTTSGRFRVRENGSWGDMTHESFLQADADALYEALGGIATHAALNDVHHPKAHGVSVHTQTPGTRALQTVAQTVSDTTLTAAIYDTSTFDDDGWWEGVTNPERITVDVAGRYLVVCQFLLAANPTGQRYSLLRKYNSAGVPTTLGEFAGDPSVINPYGRIMAIDEAEVGDYYIQFLYQASGGNLDTITLRAWLTVQRLP